MQFLYSTTPEEVSPTPEWAKLLYRKDTELVEIHRLDKKRFPELKHHDYIRYQMLEGFCCVSLLTNKELKELLR